MLQIEVSTHYDAAECQWVDDYKIPTPRPYRGLDTVLAKAQELEVQPKVAVMSRLRFLVDRKIELGKKVWGCERQAERLGTGPNRLFWPSDIRRALREAQLIEKYNDLANELKRVEAEIESLQGFINGRDTKKSNAITEDQKHDAHRKDVRLVLAAAGIEVARNNMLKCPFHDDRSESASIAKGVLVCFAGCQPGEESQKTYWDAVALYRRLFGADYYSAIRGVLAL